jgi:hexulose-6-phosphate isomerase
MIRSDMSRRDFVGSTLAVAGSIAAGSARPASAAELPPSTGEMRGRLFKSLMAGMFRETLPWGERFQVLKDCGFDGIELSSPGNLPIKEICQARDESGLLISEIVNSTHWTIRLSDPDPRKREQAVGSLRVSIKDAHALGASTVLLVVGKVSDDQEENHDQVWTRSIQGIRQCLPDAAKYGVRIAVENVWNGFCTDPKQWAAYIDELAEGSPWIGAHYDIGNHIKYGPPADWIRILGPRILKLHIKDWSRAEENAKSRGFCKLGEGDADWPEVRKALRQINYHGWAAAEVGGGDRAVMRDVVERMNSVLCL